MFFKGWHGPRFPSKECKRNEIFSHEILGTVENTNVESDWREYEKCDGGRDSVNVKHLLRHCRKTISWKQWMPPHTCLSSKVKENKRPILNFLLNWDGLFSMSNIQGKTFFMRLLLSYQLLYGCLMVADNCLSAYHHEHTLKAKQKSHIVQGSSNF